MKTPVACKWSVSYNSVDSTGRSQRCILKLFYCCFSKIKIIWSWIFIIWFLIFAFLLRIFSFYLSTNYFLYQSSFCIRTSRDLVPQEAIILITYLLHLNLPARFSLEFQSSITGADKFYEVCKLIQWPKLKTIKVKSYYAILENYTISILFFNCDRRKSQKMQSLVPVLFLAFPCLLFIGK